MKKRVISFVLTILMVVGLFSGLTFSASAEVPESGYFGTDATFSYSNGVLTVSGTGKIRSYEVGDTPVAWCEEITKIVVKSGITSLGKFCFYHCENVTEVLLPNTLTEIQNGAFCDCNSLTEITIPNSVTSVGHMNLTDCDNMETIYYMGTEEEYKKIDFSMFEDWSDFNVIYHNHKYKTTVTKATLKKNGKTVKKCTECGKTVSTVHYYPKTISLANTTYYYNGKVKSPGVTVKDSQGKKLKKGTDYSISYSGKRVSIGEYSVTVNFKGNYSGKKTLKFKVLPKIAFDSAALCVKQTKKINAKSSHKVTYKSSNSKVASVDKKGVITAKKKGKATITVTSNKLSTKIKINVSNPYVKLSKANLSVFKGKSETLTATVCPAGAKVTWSSADKKIAKVSSSGKVTGVKIGKTTVKATIKYKGKTYQKTCKVTVKKPVDFAKLVEENVDVRLIVPRVGASTNFYFTLKIVNHTGYTIYLGRFAEANGYLCNSFVEAYSHALETDYQTTVTYYNALIPQERYDSKYQVMYLDNNSTGYTTIKLKDKTIFIKYDTSGIIDVGYSLSDIDIY